ncbi:LacI family DNA-binding transcriptional regulator [candidate division KSB1 bacterium]|nr:LacI family DNA-binding transcriptional regulator [candidate division KSB1 bacterium]
MSARLIDIARKTGYSVSTVSRVLNQKPGKYPVHEKTQKQILAAAEELGYRPNIIARNLRLRKTREIGMVVPDISKRFFSFLVKIIAKHLREFDYKMIVYDADEDTGIEKDAITNLLAKKVDGLIVCPVGVESRHLEQTIQSGIPFLTMDRCFEHLKADSISVDNYNGARIAVEYLIAEGHHKIGVIHGLQGTWPNEMRLKGYQDALKQAGIKAEKRYNQCDSFGTFNGYLEMHQMLRLDDPPTAVFFAGGYILLGALKAIREKNLNVPRDISFITFDDPTYAMQLTPPISAVAQPIEEVAAMAVKLLLRRMAEPDADIENVLLQPQLIVRDSVAKLI